MLSCAGDTVRVLYFSIYNTGFRPEGASVSVAADTGIKPARSAPQSPWHGGSTGVPVFASLWPLDFSASQSAN